MKEYVTLKNPRDIEYLTDAKKRDVEFKLRLINQGFYVMHGRSAVSTVHKELEINYLIEATSSIGSEMH